MRKNLFACIYFITQTPECLEKKDAKNFETVNTIKKRQNFNIFFNNSPRFFYIHKDIQGFVYTAKKSTIHFSEIYVLRTLIYLSEDIKTFIN